MKIDIVIKLFLFQLPLWLTAAPSFSQTEKFDIVTFTPLKDFKSEQNQGMVTFSKINSTSGTFCIVSIYASITSKGSPKADFDYQWEEKAVKTFNAERNPQTSSEEIDGWNTLTGAAQAEKDGSGFYVFLTVFSGYNKNMSIISLMNDQSCISEIDEFLRSLRLDKNAAKGQETVTVQNNISDRIKTSETAVSGKYGNIIYRIPDGWTSSKNNPHYIEIFPMKLQPEESFSILLLQGKVSGASLEQELSDCWNEFALMLGAEQLRQVSGNSYNTDEAGKTMAGWEYIAGHGSVRKGNDYFVHVYVIRVKERIERVVVFSKEIRLDAIRNNIDPTLHHTPYYNDITSFIFNLRFANWTDSELPEASWKGNGIVGVWAGIGYMGGMLKTTYAIFFTNGQVFYGSRFPLCGLYKFDTYADKERVPRYWGTYSSKEGEGMVKMPYGSFPVRLEGNQLIMSPVSEEHKFIRMPSVDNMKLNGTWMITGVNDQPFTITFRSDGTFTDNGALKVLDHSIYEYYSIADGGGKGKYSIINHTVIFSYSDGRILTIAFPGKGINPGDVSPKELILSYNDDLLIKQ